MIKFTPISEPSTHVTLFPHFYSLQLARVQPTTSSRFAQFPLDKRDSGHPFQPLERTSPSLHFHSTQRAVATGARQRSDCQSDFPSCLSVCPFRLLSCAPMPIITIIDQMSHTKRVTSSSNNSSNKGSRRGGGRQASNKTSHFAFMCLIDGDDVHLGENVLSNDTV